MKTPVLLLSLLVSTLLKINCLNSQTLTVRDVYDLHPGDEIGLFIDYYNSYLKGPHEYKFLKVINREDFGNDSFTITYFMSRQYYKNLEWPTEHKTFTTTYRNLDKPFFARFTGRDTVIPIYKPHDSIMDWDFNYIFKDSIYTDSCNTLINWRHISAHTPLSGSFGDDTIAFKGLGILVRSSLYDAYLIEEHEYLVYYKKDGKLCGNKEGFPVSIDNTVLTEITISPNPAMDFINLYSDQPSEYIIYNLHGHALMSGKAEGQTKIEIKELTAGLYIITFESDGRIASQVLVVE